ncbi:SAM-dependent methyltransferase [Rhizobium sp. BK313]|uniref:methyltransferase n=1 Tax=Rhizobium sp. BK313 TaxID=2587081 RepID=UPI00105BC639|nr:methyltransferase [Rhizobium sp. BK313]MBB3452600.1 SAM-dependent methyltransferase [Rhizobium sp. BK313]
MLAAFGIFRIDREGAITHTSRSLLLRTDVPNSMHYGARSWTVTGSWRAWEDLDAAFHGKVPHEVAWGTGRFDYLRRIPDEARIFDAFMANFPDKRHSVVAETYDFSKARLIADIGGGNGETLRRILALYPATRGIVFDRTDVVAAIPRDALAGGRITTHDGNFFDGVPADADIYLLIRVLHDWPDDDASRILRSCRAAMQRDARLLVIEGLINPDPCYGSPTEYLVDMQMMAMFGSARERTEAEFRELLNSAGFDLTSVIGTASPVFILEASLR